MLHHILQAYDGRLPDHCHVLFADTGKEHPATYDFIRECAERWRIKIEWLAMGHEGYDTPFDALIARKKYLPNPRTRFCTEYLKIRPIRAFMKAQGYDRWANIIGLRADEPGRVKKALDRCTKFYTSVAPLWEAGVTKDMVMDWWSRQPFDLRAPEGCGNCIGCFMKGRDTLIATEQRHPGSLAWWAEKEKQIGATFRPKNRRMTYAEMIDFANRQGNLPLADSTESIACACTD